MKGVVCRPKIIRMIFLREMLSFFGSLFSETRVDKKFPET